MQVGVEASTSDNSTYAYCTTVRWMIEMAQGLKYLHQCQPMVIHRDLKLENILLQGTDPRTLSTKIAGEFELEHNPSDYHF